MTPEVAEAIREIATAYPACPIETKEDGAGGAYVTVNDMAIGTIYVQSTSWIGFHVTHTYPYSDIYPHFVRHDLTRKDGKPLGEATSTGNFRGQPAVQLSRKNNKHDASSDTALLKLQKVVKWLISRP